MKEVINLLWTGGWDSTFRLLDLVLTQKKKVQPYYLISSGRQSSQVEIRTMDTIRALIYKKDTQAKALLLPTIYKEVDSVKPNETLTQQYERLKAAKHLGTQYDYLARFAEEEGVDALELSVHKDDHAQKFLQPYVVAEGNEGNYKLQDNPSYSDLALFQYFRFPILSLTKLDMQAYAKKHDFLDIMNETVFCHTPLPNGKPCGYCNPCRYTMEEGLSRRIPFIPRLKFHIKKLIKG